MTHEPTKKFTRDFVPYIATDPKISWVEGVAILAAVMIVVLVGSINDYQKEAQFRKLNAKKEDREVKVTNNSKSKRTMLSTLLPTNEYGMKLWTLTYL